MTANSIMIIDGGTDTFNGSVTMAGVGACRGFMVCVGSTVVFAPGSTLNDGGVLQVGVGGVGAFPGQWNQHPCHDDPTGSGIIGNRVAGVGTVTIDDASWTTTTFLLVGAFGTGTLDVVDGGHVTVGSSLVLGFHPGSSGTVTLSSGGVISVDGSASLGSGSTTAPSLATV